MTVSSVTNRKTFAGDAVTTSFGTSPVVFFDTSDLVIKAVTDATGAVETLVENTDYTVSGGSGSTGTVSLAGGTSPYGAPAVGVTLVILRVLPLTQTDDFVNNDPSDAEVIEDRFDKITMGLQQLDEVDSRALKLPEGETGTDALTTLPTDRASYYLGFDASKNPVALSAPTSTSITTAYTKTLLAAADAAAARTILGTPATADVLPISGGTLTGNLQIDSTDAGATAGPSVTLYRNSATPAASDLIGQHVFSGEDSAGNTQTYATVTGNIVDPTSGSEDGQLIVATVIAGTLANRVRFGAGVYTENATGGDQGVDTVNASAIYDDGVQVGPTVIVTMKASTSGTTVAFPSLPSGIKEFKMTLSGVSTNGISALLSQLGDSGGMENSGYTSLVVGASNGSTGNGATSTAGLILNSASVAAQTVRGTIEWTLIDPATFLWTGVAKLMDSGGVVWNAVGEVTLDSELTQVQLTSVSADTFDLGNVGLIYKT